MKVCPKCARQYGDQVQLCKKCNLELAGVAPYAADDDPQKRKKDWLWILIGTPLFILFIKFIYNLMIKLK